ncbi:MAG TPA: Gfo/Idh/MocA family oxidoreductase [Spirochaetia bacterium]|nr:Gfo/Idh/MocA family oxidoreductase [Spirochaetia bacterium]
MLKRIGIGQLGYGGIGKVHAHAYRSIGGYYPGVLPEIKLVAVAASSRASSEKAAAEGGFERAYTTIEELVADPDVTVIDCSLPNFVHKQAIEAALAAGKHIYCEKPLCVNGAEARELLQKAGRSSSLVGMTFNYRFVPAIVRARALVEADALGEIYNFRFVYLHTGYQDPSRPASWRMQSELAGGGALFDLGSHVIDLARFLLGEIAEVNATSATYVTERPRSKGSTEAVPVTVDDAMWLHARLSSGATGSFEVSRFATGSLDDLRFRIEGKKGALTFSLMDGNWLYWYDATKSGGAYGGELGWTRLETASYFPGAAIPTPRSILGWERTHAENQYRFLKSITDGTRPSPGLEDGAAVQLVMEAAYESVKRRGWVQTPSL